MDGTMTAVTRSANPDSRFRARVIGTTTAGEAVARAAGASKQAANEEDHAPH